MKKTYSIGYTDKYDDFRKVWDNLGYTKKFETIEEAENYIQQKIAPEYININKPIKIMQGWKVIKEIFYKEA